MYYFNLCLHFVSAYTVFYLNYYLYVFIFLTLLKNFLVKDNKIVIGFVITKLVVFIDCEFRSLLCILFCKKKILHENLLKKNSKFLNLFS